MNKEDEILVELGKLNAKFDDVIKPAVDQAWDNKDNILRIMGFQKVIKYVGGTTVATTAVIVGKIVYGFISKLPPPPPPSIHP